MTETQLTLRLPREPSEIHHGGIILAFNDDRFTGCDVGFAEAGEDVIEETLNAVCGFLAARGFGETAITTEEAIGFVAQCWALADQEGSEQNMIGRMCDLDALMATVDREPHERHWFVALHDGMSYGWVDDIEFSRLLLAAADPESPTDFSEWFEYSRQKGMVTQ